MKSYQIIFLLVFLSFQGLASSVCPYEEKDTAAENIISGVATSLETLKKELDSNPSKECGATSDQLNTAITTATNIARVVGDIRGEEKRELGGWKFNNQSLFCPETGAHLQRSMRVHVENIISNSYTGGRGKGSMVEANNISISLGGLTGANDLGEILKSCLGDNENIPYSEWEGCVFNESSHLVSQIWFNYCVNHSALLSLSGSREELDKQNLANTIKSVVDTTNNTLDILTRINPECLPSEKKGALMRSFTSGILGLASSVAPGAIGLVAQALYTPIVNIINKLVDQPRKKAREAIDELIETNEGDGYLCAFMNFQRLRCDTLRNHKDGKKECVHKNKGIVSLLVNNFKHIADSEQYQRIDGAMAMYNDMEKKYEASKGRTPEPQLTEDKQKQKLLRTELLGLDNALFTKDVNGNSLYDYIIELDAFNQGNLSNPLFAKDLPEEVMVEIYSLKELAVAMKEVADKRKNAAVSTGKLRPSDSMDFFDDPTFVSSYHKVSENIKSNLNWNKLIDYRLKFEDKVKARSAVKSKPINNEEYSRLEQIITGLSGIKKAIAPKMEGASVSGGEIADRKNKINSYKNFMQGKYVHDNYFKKYLEALPKIENINKKRDKYKGKLGQFFNENFREPLRDCLVFNDLYMNYNTNEVVLGHTVRADWYRKKCSEYIKCWNLPKEKAVTVEGNEYETTYCPLVSFGIGNILDGAEDYYVKSQGKGFCPSSQKGQD